MNMWSFAFGVVLLIMAGIIYLWYLANQGDPMAMTALAILGVSAIFGLFKGLDIISDTLRDRAEQKRFNENTKENFAILQSGFRAQSAAIAAQRQTMKQMEPNKPGQVIDLPEDMFNSIEEV